MFTGTREQVIAWLQAQPMNALFEVKQHRQRRSLTQNAYYWVLLNKLARDQGIADDELHFMMLQDYGVCDVFSVRADVPYTNYFRYYKEIGHGRANGKLFRHIKVWKGSSQMDSKEFTNLLEGLIHECQQVGIQTATPQELAQMRFVEGQE